MQKLYVLECEGVDDQEGSLYFLEKNDALNKMAEMMVADRFERCMAMYEWEFPVLQAPAVLLRWCMHSPMEHMKIARCFADGTDPPSHATVIAALSWHDMTVKAT